MVKLVEVRAVNKYSGTEESFMLREVYINPQHVVALREDHTAKKCLHEGKMPADMDHRQVFTKIHLNRGQNGIDITDVGSPVTIENHLKTGKQLLKG